MKTLTNSILKYKITQVEQVQKIAFWITLCLFLAFLFVGFKNINAAKKTSEIKTVNTEAPIQAYSSL